MRIGGLFLGAICLVLPVDANAEFLDGNALLQECEIKSRFCSGYLHALVEVSGKTADIVQGPYQICLSDGVQAGQVRDVVLNALRARPQDRNVTASYLVISALMEAWPCKK